MPMAYPHHGTADQPLNQRGWGGAGSSTPTPAACSPWCAATCWPERCPCGNPA